MSHAEEEARASIDPAIALASQALAGRVVPLDPSVHSPEEMRRLAEASAALWADGGPAIAQIEDLEIATRAGRMRARWLDPRGQRTYADAAILFLHGGGWTIGSVDTHDRLMRCLAAETGRPVLGIDYRLSPDHAFPAALDDSLDAFAWLADQAERLNVDPTRIAIAGDSSGANLGLATAIARRDRGETPPAVLAFFYPCLTPDFDSESHRVHGDGHYGLSTERLAYYWRNYLGAQAKAPPPLATPSRAPLEGLPPTYIGLAELDPLADDGRRLAEQLTSAGVPVRLDCWRGAIHGFLQMSRDVALARDAVKAAADFLSRQL